MQQGLQAGVLGVSGASGKTGWRVVDEALRRGHTVRAIVRPGSLLPPELAEAEQQGRLEVRRLELPQGELPMRRTLAAPAQPLRPDPGVEAPGRAVAAAKRH
jgi:NAD(P)-dependent dehydrogenase (short-subunit alcohol dehydrogenase family)